MLYIFVYQFKNNGNCLYSRPNMIVTQKSCHSSAIRWYGSVSRNRTDKALRHTLASSLCVAREYISGHCFSYFVIYLFGYSFGYCHSSMCTVRLFIYCEQLMIRTKSSESGLECYDLRDRDGVVVSIKPVFTTHSQSRLA